MLAADAAEANLEINTRIDYIQHIFDEMTYRFIENNAAGFSGLFAKYTKVIEKLTKQYNKWRTEHLETTTKQRVFVEVFNISAKYLLKVGENLEAMKNAATDMNSPRGKELLFQAFLFDMITDFKTNADAFSAFGAILSQVDNYFNYNEPEMITEHFDLIEKYFEVLDNMKARDGKDLISVDGVDADPTLSDAEQRKAWLVKMRFHHQDITDSFQRVLYIIRDIDPRVKYTDYPKISSEPLFLPIEMQYDNVSLTSNFNQLPSMRSMLFIALSTWSNIVKNIHKEHYNTIEYKLRMPAMNALVKMFFNSVDVDIVAPQSTSLTIIANCESILRTGALIDRYNTELSGPGPADPANTEKLKAAMTQAVETLRSNMDEIFYAIIASFPEQTLTLFNKYDELAGGIDRMVTSLQNAMNHISEDKQNFLSTFLPTIEVMHQIGLKIRGISLHHGAAFFPTAYIYLLFHLDMITRFRPAVQGMDVIIGCLNEMNETQLNFTEADRTLIDYQRSTIAAFFNNFDESIDIFQRMCADGTVSDVSSRMEWLDRLDQRHMGIAVGYHYVFIHVMKFLPPPQTDALKQNYDKFLRESDYVTVVFYETAQAFKNNNANQDANQHANQHANLVQEHFASIGVPYNP